MSWNQDKISIIVPVYNSALWLEKCVHSLINQSHTNIEIILINDGSTDESGIICDKFAQKDNRIKVIHQENQGVSRARNTGIVNSSGHYIQFVDSDDWIESETCEVLIKNIINSQAELAICGLNITLNNEIIRTPHLDHAIINYREDQSHYWNLRKINLGPCNKLYIKDKITKLFDVERSLGEDTMFVLDYLNNINKIVSIDKCLYNVRLDNSNSLNRKYRHNRFDLILSLLQYEKNFYFNIYSDKCEMKEMNNQFILAAHSCFRDVVGAESFKIAIQLINKYLKNKELLESSKDTFFERFDYRFFNSLLKLRSKLMIYLFFKFKFLLLKTKGNILNKC